MKNEAFLTGSRVYGTPGPKSDVDLVILADKATINALRKLEDKILLNADGKIQAETNTPSKVGYQSASIRFGNLNLIVVMDQDEFDCWRLATKALETEKPVTKQRAVELHEWLRKGVKRPGQNKPAIPSEELAF